MPASAPDIVEVDVTAIPVPIAEDANVPVPLRLTTSGAITPFSVAVIVAEVLPSYSLLFATAFDNVNDFAVILAVNDGNNKL